MSHYYSKIPNTKFHSLWDIIPTSSIDVKVMHLISSGNGDTLLLLVPLKKIGMPLLNALARVNIEYSNRILHPLNYGEDMINPYP